MTEQEKRQKFINQVESLFEVPYENIIVFDIEVFKYQSSVVFCNLDQEVVRIYTDNLAGLGQYVDEGVLFQKGYDGMAEWLEDKVLLGYNNYFYDDFILYAMSNLKLNPYIKEWNDNIIDKGSKVNMKKFDICRTYDVMQQIDVSRPGLKKIEGNLGHNIMESTVDFNTDRQLTPQENKEVIEYNINDVIETITIFKMRLEYFESKKEIIKMLPEDLQEKAYKWNTTSIVGQLLKYEGNVPRRRLVSDELLELVPLDVQNMWRQLDNTIDYKFKQKKVLVDECGVTFEFGWGGLHAVPKGLTKRKNVKLLDCSSMYPNILILFKGLAEKTPEYKSILDYRLQLKHEGKKKEQAPYKLILTNWG